MSRTTKNKAVPDSLPNPEAGGLDALDALKRQVTALQRISSMGLLAGGVFHELNNALTPVISYAKLALRNPDPEYRERALKKILEAGERAAAITGGMLGMTRPGHAPNHREPIDMGRLVDDVVMLAGKDLNRHNVRLDVQIVDRPFAQVNATQIQQVLVNLLINARQAMPGGGLVTLRLATDPSGRRVELSVAPHLPPARSRESPRRRRMKPTRRDADAGLMIEEGFRPIPSPLPGGKGISD
jgi:signal transduction histidine kinase